MKRFSRRVVALSLGLSLVPSSLPAARAADSDLNFKLYSPGANAPAAPETSLDSASVTDKSSLQPQSDVVNDAPGPMTSEDLNTTSTGKAPVLKQELPHSDTASTAKGETDNSEGTASLRGLPATTATTESSKASGQTANKESTASSASATSSATTSPANTAPADVASSATKEADTATKTSKESATADTADNGAPSTDGESSGKVLQGYARVVPSGTKFPIVMDTAVDSDTSQEGDEFSARTSEDLSIDGQTLVPAGSIIKGRIASLNAPRRMNRTGSVALKFDTITTPDNRQIPLVANLVARGGVVHARRGLKDIAIDATEFTLPSVAGLGIGCIGGARSSKIGAAGGAVIGTGVGVALGLAILLAKKGKKVDVRPGDELKVELAEDLRMPTL